MSEWKEPTHEHLHSRRAANLRQNVTRETSVEVTLGEMKLYEALKPTVLKLVLDVSTVTVPKVIILQQQQYQFFIPSQWFASIFFLKIKVKYEWTHLFFFFCLFTVTFKVVERPLNKLVPVIT